MISAKNIRVRPRKGEVMHVLFEPSAAVWNARAADRLKALFLKLYGFDAENLEEAKYWINKYFKK